MPDLSETPNNRTIKNEHLEIHVAQSDIALVIIV
jgi:hypothetical protein